MGSQAPLPKPNGGRVPLFWALICTSQTSFIFDIAFSFAPCAAQMGNVLNRSMETCPVPSHNCFFGIKNEILHTFHKHFDAFITNPGSNLLKIHKKVHTKNIQTLFHFYILWFLSVLRNFERGWRQRRSHSGTHKGGVLAILFGWRRLYP